MEKIFDLTDLRDGDDGDTDETELIDEINDTLLCYECDDFDELIRRFVDIYIKIPRIAECFQLIKRRFENNR